MNICGVLVHARPEILADVEQALLAFPGVELHGRGEGGKLVLTLEDTPGQEVADTMHQFNYVTGVINTTLIYHYGGDD